MRGWGRYEVAPLIDGIPSGGRALLDLSAELRVPLRTRLGLVVFADAGNVWPTSAEFGVRDLRYDAGTGVRYTTPIGLVRADIGVQINPVPGLLIDGEPQTRRWRVHLSIGQAF